MAEDAKKTVENPVAAAAEVMSEASAGLGAFSLTACIRCGNCADSCHIYKTEPETANMPAAKAAKVSSLFRRTGTLLGRLLPGVTGARELTEETLKDLVDAVYGRCTMCGRCAEFCAAGADVYRLLRLGRRMCAVAGLVPESLNRTMLNQVETGNQMAIPAEEFVETCSWLSEDLAMETGDDDAKIPVDEKGKRILYLVNPREVKFFPLSLSAAAGIFHTAGESWTMSKEFFDMTNYAYYTGDDKTAADLTKNMLATAEKLGVEEVVLSECGHGYLSFFWEGPGWTGEKYPIKIRSMMELIENYITEGKIRLDGTKVTERVTLHDPCNLVRLGGMVELQRRILALSVSDFVEMVPNRERNYCCGGGGGMLSMSEYGPRRVKSGKIKADQIKATGAKIVATPCHNCADQLIELSKVYKLGVEIKAVTEIVFDALADEENKDSNAEKPNE